MFEETIKNFNDFFQRDPISVACVKLAEEEIFREYSGKLLLKLPEDARQRVLRYKRPADMQRSLIGELLSRYMIRKIIHQPEESIEFHKTDKGKPYLANYGGIHFNISHSGDWVVVALSDQEVGIDIERIKPTDYKVAERFFSHEEVKDLNSREGYEKQKFFFTLWTLKESYLKMLAKGLTKSLNSFSVIQRDGEFTLESRKGSPQAFFRILFPDTSHILSVCSPQNRLPDEMKKIDISTLFDV